VASLMVHRNILKNYSKLPGKVQKRIPELIAEFQHDPQSPAIGMHPLQGTMLDPKVRGVSKLPDGYRAIVIAPEQGDTYLLVHIDAHDKAYDWAKNKRFEVHQMTGVFQVFDAEQVDAVAAETKTPVYAAVSEPSYPLAKLTDEQLFSAGVPEPLIPAVKSIKSDAAFEALAEYLPPDCRDVLFGIAAGMSLDEAIEEMLFGGSASVEAAKVEGPGDFTQIQTAPNFDLVFAESEEAFKEILESSLEEWRVFLHPYQRKLVNWKTKGPMKITGAAGTGKTVALIHRAVQLARKLSAASDKVLITTFTTNLSYTIRHAVEKLAPDVTGKIDVTNLHSLARTICSRAGWKGRVAEDEDLSQVWEATWPAHTEELPLSRDEMQNEYHLIVEQHGIDNEDAYLTAVRSGRPRISRKDRKAAWPVFETFNRGLKKRQLLTFEGSIHEARLAVENGKFNKYAHVLVDEVQDFSFEALRLIYALSTIKEGHMDPLCIVGDGHQRVYGTNIPMSRAGIDVRGRSRRLKINYRTSEQIRLFAQGILEGVEADDLDGGITSTVGDHSLFKGPQPWVEQFKEERAEADAIVTWIQMLLSDPNLHMVSHEICVTPYKPLLRTALKSAGIESLEIEAREEDPGEKEPGVRLASMQRIKGLEFRAVAMCCSQPGDAMNHLKDASIKDRCERYVAATRARERLFVSVAKS
jgi:mRNA-degrading endonuclease RelE of RelBE toxin-antitoxin system